MAFIPSLPVKPSLHSSSLSPPRNTLNATPSATTSTLRMGYGAYSYQTDRTKGHVGQYYVDKFRTVYDFAKGAPASSADAFLGCDAKHSKLIPSEGIAQPIDPILLPMPAPEDPRTLEASGAAFPWDIAYKDPQYAKDTFADVDDESVAENAFAKFRSSVSEQRGMALTAMDFGAAARVQRLVKGLSEDYLLCLDGALDAQYLRLQKIANPMGLSPTGTPQTEIPGMDYMGAVGALDFVQKKETEVAFWNDTPGMEGETKSFKKPAGNRLPEGKYNTSTDVDTLKEAQKVRGLLPEVE